MHIVTCEQPAQGQTLSQPQTILKPQTTLSQPQTFLLLTERKKYMYLALGSLSAKYMYFFLSVNNSQN